MGFNSVALFVNLALFSHIYMHKKCIATLLYLENHWVVEKF